ncbi:MAG: hypothetical protein PGN13_00230 [Patulibacter minatonensis]
MSSGAIERYRALTQVGWPRRYPLVQFPNTPLWVSFAASAIGAVTGGTVQDYVAAVGTVGIVVWAWQELFSGVNAFRHVLGAAVLTHTVITLAGQLS